MRNTTDNSYNDSESEEYIFEILWLNKWKVVLAVLVCLCIAVGVPILFVKPCQSVYHTALMDTFLFLESQRSGKLPPDQRVKWRGDSGLLDGLDSNVDLVGGYYIDGSNVKLGLPMAFTVTMLSWSVIEYGSLMGDQLDAAKTAVKWGSDYLQKAAATTENTIYVQVGDVDLNDTCWQRPEDMKKLQQVYNVSGKNPGSDVAGEIAAALATSSFIFRQSDPTYSSRLIRIAEKVFYFADRYRGTYNASNSSSSCSAHCASSGYNDELLWSASWLYLVTENSKYLRYVQRNIDYINNDDKERHLFNWNDKTMGAKLLLAKLYLQRRKKEYETFKDDVDKYFCSLFPTFSASVPSYTRGGLLYQNTDDNIQYVTSTTFLLLTYANYLQPANESVYCGLNTIEPKELIRLARTQVDYILGRNPARMSYMVGYQVLSKKYLRHIHHRGSSIPSINRHPSFISCKSGIKYLNSISPNPNILVGAVAGSPNLTDYVDDDRLKFWENQPATYINAPLTGPLAYYHYYYRSSVC